jgi:predicted nucleotidyltransferase
MLNKLTKKELNRLSKKYGIRSLYIFGSRAIGREKLSSDYDFAVILDEKIKKEKYSQYKLNIISELLRLVNTDHIDLVILNSDDVPLLLKYNIIKEGKVIFDKNKSERVNCEVHILRLWLDWQYFEKMWWDIRVAKFFKNQNKIILNS